MINYKLQQERQWLSSFLPKKRPNPFQQQFYSDCDRKPCNLRDVCLNLFHQGPGVGRPVIASPGVKFQIRFLFLLFKSTFFGTIFSLFWGVQSCMQTEVIAKLKLLFRLSYLNSNFALTGLVILINPALNKPSGPAGCDPRL